MYHTATVKGGCLIRPVLFCGQIPQEIEAALAAHGYGAVRLPPHKTLPHPVSSHPDMLLSPLPSGKLLITKDYFDQNEALLSPYRDSFLVTDEPLGAIYPDDVKLNALAIGDTLYGGKTLARTLKNAYKTVITVKQGYTACSACRIGKGIVTADPSLYKALSENGVKVLLISPGGITLEPYGTGFIGGASVALSDTLTAFFGKIESHPDYPRIAAFAKAQNVTLLSLSDIPLADYGGGYLKPE